MLINEGSDFTVTAATRGSTNEAVTPTALRYRIDCLATGREILGWTVVSSPGATNVITVPGSLNYIINLYSSRERRQMTVETSSGPNVRNDTVDWEVRNILGVR